MPGAADKKWDASVERDLCIAMIHGNQDISDRVKHNWARIATFMTNMGYTFTKDAISQHFTKVMMKDFKKRHGEAILSSSTPQKPMVTPKKRGSAAAKRTKTESVDNDDDDDDEQVYTPTKRQKSIKLETPSKVKQESGTSRSRARSITVRPNYNVDGDDGDEEDEFKHWMKDEDE